MSSGLHRRVLCLFAFCSPGFDLFYLFVQGKTTSCGEESGLILSTTCIYCDCAVPHGIPFMELRCLWTKEGPTTPAIHTSFVQQTYSSDIAVVFFLFLLPAHIVPAVSMAQCSLGVENFD